MTLLFTSYRCDYCDGLVEVDWQSGFIVFRGEGDFSRPVHAFPTRTDAALFRQLNGWGRMYQVREIHFEHPVEWKAGSGKLVGITIAARAFELHRDHRFESRPYAGYLVPLEPSAATAITT
jgi:hypothetical protein